MQPLKQFDIKGMNVRWDQFDLLHQYTDWRTVIHFQTGEMCVTTQHRGRMEKSDYRLCKERNIMILSTTDFDSRQLLHDHGLQLCHPETGEKIVDSWLQKRPAGGTRRQMLVVDLDHDVAVRLDPARVTPPRTPHLDWAPRHIQRARGVYYPTPTSRPLGYPVTVCRPHKLTPEERAHKTKLEASVRTWWALSGWAETGRRLGVLGLANKLAEVSGEGSHRWIPWRGPTQWWHDVKDMDLADMSPLKRWWIMVGGIKVQREEEVVDYLKVKRV